MIHDDFCPGVSRAHDGTCAGCEAVRVIRADTAFHIEEQMRGSMGALPVVVRRILRQWHRQPESVTTAAH